LEKRLEINRDGAARRGFGVKYKSQILDWAAGGREEKKRNLTEI